jgi:hypothetical protein
MRRRSVPPARVAPKSALAPPSDRQCQRLDRTRHPTVSATRVAQVVLGGKLVIEADAGTMPNRPARIGGRRYLEVVRAVWAAAQLCRDEEAIGSTRCSMRMPLAWRGPRFALAGYRPAGHGKTDARSDTQGRRDESITARPRFQSYNLK